MRACVLACVSCVVLCRVVSCRVVLCCGVLCCGVLCRVVSCCVVLCRVVSCRILLCCVVLVWCWCWRACVRVCCPFSFGLFPVYLVTYVVVRNEARVPAGPASGGSERRAGLLPRGGPGLGLGVWCVWNFFGAIFSSPWWLGGQGVKPLYIPSLQLTWHLREGTWPPFRCHVSGREGNIRAYVEF